MEKVSIKIVDLPGMGGVSVWKNNFENYCIKKNFIIGADKNDIFIDIAGLASKEYLLKIKKQNTKIISRIDGIYGYDFYKEEANILNNGMVEAFQLSDYIILQSNYSKHLVSNIFNIDSKPHSIIYNGVDTSLFYPNRKIISKKKIILSVAHFGTAKMSEYSINVLIEIAKKFIDNDEYEFWILGVALGDAENMLKKNNLINIKKFDLHTNLNRNEMANLLNSVDLVLHVRPRDACSNLILECLACNVPIVGLDSGSTKELLGPFGMTGKCYEKDFNDVPIVDVNDMVNKIKWVFSNYESYKEKMACKIPLTVEQMCEMYINVIYNILNK